MKKKSIDNETQKLIEELAGKGERPSFSNAMHDNIRRTAYTAYQKCELSQKNARPEDPGEGRLIADFFMRLKEIKMENGFFAEQLGFPKEELVRLALRHQETDEHGVSLGGRVTKAISHVKFSSARISQYQKEKDLEAPSGIILWPKILENRRRIQKALRMRDEDWNSYKGQYENSIDSLLTLSQIISLPEKALVDLMRVTQKFPLRISPYYASLITPGRLDDPVLIQCLPTAETLENKGEKLPIVTREYSPSRLVDQFHPRCATIKATTICPLHCVYCYRMDQVHQKDRVFSLQAFNDALHYIRKNENIRDVSISGGDAFMLPNKLIAWLLNELDKIGHVKVKRLGTRVPVSLPHRVNAPLLEIIAKSNNKKPIRIMTQVNSVQEITPVSLEIFRRLSKSVSAINSQTVLLKGVNDTRNRLWSLCETLQEAYVKPYQLLNCCHRNPYYAHLRVPIGIGQDLVEGMHGGISEDAIPNFVTFSGGDIPMEKACVSMGYEGQIRITRPWSGQETFHPDADKEIYQKANPGLLRYK